MAKAPPLTDPRFESAPLDTSRPQLRRQYPYEHYILNEFGSLNLDANDSTLQKGELTDALNLRMTKPGEYEVRTGYTNYPCSYGGAVTLLCKTEFRYKNFILDISVVWYNNEVRIQGVNNVIFGGGLWSAMNAKLLTPKVCDATTLPIAAAAQYQNYIIVTVYDIGTFAFYPIGTLDSTSQFDTWTCIPLGKNLATTPWEVNYVDDHVDDLINFQYDVESRALGASITTYPVLKNNPQSSGDSSLMPPFLYDRLKIKTPYRRTAETGQPFDVFGIKLWQWSQYDKSAKQTSPRAHLQTRAWGYRFVFIRSVPDGRGGKIVFRSQASADMWVPNNSYSPPQPLQQDPANINQVNRRPFTLECNTPNSWTILDSRGSASANKYPDVSAVAPFVNSVITVPPPTPLTILLDEPMVSFAQAIADYEGVSNVVGIVNTPVYYPKTPFLYFTMWYAGFRICGAANTTISFSKFTDSAGTYATPYWTEVPASFLAQAPLTIFKWTDFSLLADGTNNPNFPSDVTEIEVYRTAFSDGDAKTTNGDPLFQPDLYGYVGSIKASKDFTDDIKDTAIDFAKSPDLYDGYLAGQFSGQAIRRYNRKLVIGNTSTSYWVDAPAPFVLQAFTLLTGTTGSYTVGDSNATKDVFTPSADPLDKDPSDNKLNKMVQFYSSYVDAEGNESDLAKIYLDYPDLATFGTRSVGFILGQGYSPYITAVRLYKSYLVSGTRIYFFIKEIDVGSGYYYSDNLETPIATYTSRPGKHTSDGTPGGKITRTPGGVTWSGVYAPFDWDPLNFEVISTEAPITYLDSLIGEFWVFTDRGVHLSNIDNANPKGEEESEEIGVIGRFAAIKVDKVIFFLSAGGLYFAESSGVHPFPGSVQTEILKYINEQIDGQPDLANMRRASMGYSKKRQELWVYLPSSVDLPGGTLPAKIFVFKFFSKDIDAASIRRHVNYQFELTNPGDADIGIAAKPVIFSGHSDGRLFCSYQGFTHNIHTLDNDLGAWSAGTSLEFVMGLIDLTTIKMLRKLEITGDFDCDLKIYTGIANPTHTHSGSPPDFPRGLVNAQATQYTVDEAMMGTNVKLPHVVSESLWNTTGNAPVIRLVTQPDSDGNNTVRYKAIDVWYQFIHDHP